MSRDLVDVLFDLGFDLAFDLALVTLPPGLPSGVEPSGAPHVPLGVQVFCSLNPQPLPQAHNL